MFSNYSYSIQNVPERQIFFKIYFINKAYFMDTCGKFNDNECFQVANFLKLWVIFVIIVLDLFR